MRGKNRENEKSNFEKSDASPRYICALTLPAKVCDDPDDQLSRHCRQMLNEHEFCRKKRKKMAKCGVARLLLKLASKKIRRPRLPESPTYAEKSGGGTTATAAK